ncbi:MAG: amidase [Gammaproteobacteria bacterium]|jgi:amidase
MNRSIGSHTLEPVVLEIYKLAKTIAPHRFLDGLAWINSAGRDIGTLFSNYDLLLSPSTAVTAPQHGVLGLDHEGFDPVEYYAYGDRPIQFSFPFNVSGAPAISLPLTMHSNGLSIGIQLAGRPAEDHVVIALESALEEALPWNKRTPPLHVSKM